MWDFEGTPMEDGDQVLFADDGKLLIGTIQGYTHSEQAYVTIVVPAGTRYSRSSGQVFRIPVVGRDLQESHQTGVQGAVVGEDLLGNPIRVGAYALISIGNAHMSGGLVAVSFEEALLCSYRLPTSVEQLEDVREI